MVEDLSKSTVFFLEIRGVSSVGTIMGKELNGTVNWGRSSLIGKQFAYRFVHFVPRLDLLLIHDVAAGFEGKNDGLDHDGRQGLE
jgi:hypothetical protein